MNHIVRETVGQLVAGRDVKAVEKLRIVDPACGSGSFLIQVYQFLLDWHLEWYVKHDANKLARAKNAPVFMGPFGEWRLTTAERKRILLNGVFGVDIDPQAVEVTKLSLLLKVLEGESEQTLNQNLSLFHARALPDLHKNIRCGNSLVGPEAHKQLSASLLDDAQDVIAFDWKDAFPEVFSGGGFSAVVGNPPYGQIPDSFKALSQRLYLLTEGRIDFFELFLERALILIQPKGFLGFIIPSPFLTNLYSRKLREHFREHCTLLEIDNFGMDVFADPTVHTCIIVLRKTLQPNHSVRIRKSVARPDALNAPADYLVNQSELGRNRSGSFDVFVDPATNRFSKRLAVGAQELGEVCYIRQCIKTGNDTEYVSNFDKVPPAPWVRTLRGRGMDRYQTLERNLYLKYGTWLARNWQNKTFYETEKIIVRETGKRIVATLDSENCYLLSSLYSVYPKDTANPKLLRYLLGFINSRLATYLLRTIALDITAGAFTKVRTNQLARLPIRYATSGTCNDILQAIDVIVAAVERLLSINEAEGDRSPAKRESRLQQIASLEESIERSLATIYELTPMEVEAIKSSVSQRE